MLSGFPPVRYFFVFFFIPCFCENSAFAQECIWVGAAGWMNISRVSDTRSVLSLFNTFPLLFCRLVEVCGKCGEALSRTQPAVRAMNKLFHSNCFCCMSCHRPLQGMQFYDRDGSPECEDCYMVRRHTRKASELSTLNIGFQLISALLWCIFFFNWRLFLFGHVGPVFFPQNSLAVCSRCGEKITDRVLKAVGQCFHAHCFRCSTCSCVLEGAPFITDDNNNPYCVQDYHR